MKLKDLKIGSQLMLGFGIMLMFVIILGFISYRQSEKIQLQTELIYNHSLKVRRAISIIKIDILTMRLATRDLLIASNDEEKQAAIQLMEIATSNVPIQFNVLREQYLGPQSDVDETYNAYFNWKIARDVNTKLALEGKTELVKKNVLANSTVGKYRTLMMNDIKRIDDFASAKGDLLFENSNRIIASLNLQLLIIVIVILLLMIVISYMLIRSIRNPIKKLTDATIKFRQGDMNARSMIETKNEFGILSESFNSMVESIQLNIELTKKTTDISHKMLLEEDPHKFFTSVLPVIASETNSQMAAVYLLSEDKKQFEHFESFGMSDNTKLTFKVNNFEGEFGSVLSTQKVQKVKRIPKDTRFMFHTVSGKIVPREIITIPIISSNEIIAIISLASVRTYSNETGILIQNLLDTLTARIEGVLAYQKMQFLSSKLELQNYELGAQKNEMSAQSSELMEQNRELEIQKIQLSESSQLKTNFLSNMSHELRTPLNSVIALSGVLNRRLADKIPADEYSYLEVIERNGKHLLSLINDILDISRIEAGKEEIEITKFSIKNLLSDLVSMIQPQAKQKNIELNQIIPPKDIIMQGDVDKLRHVLQNLIGNAVKFTEKGKVEITTTQHDNSLEIIVSDTGIGISENHIDHIFDEFRQADAGTSRKFGGTGLGLAIAKKYAKLLGGTIVVKSKLGEGSSFILTLPMNYNLENRIIEATTHISRFNQVTPVYNLNPDSQKTILLVDDSEPAIIQLKDFMEESGYKILVAHNGPEALEVISHIIPDAMILDLMMPEMDGFQVLQTIRNAESTSHIPVLILTAKNITKEDLSFLKRNNVHQLIQKGDVNREELLNSVAGLVFIEKEEIEKQHREIRKIVGKPVILIVEDNPDNLITVKAILDNKYTILEARDGTQGFQMANEHLPHLILMDIALPGVNGIEAFNVIRNTGLLAHIPIIALTASAMTLDRETILAHGFDSYISKPIDEKVFFNTINKVLNGK